MREEAQGHSDPFFAEGEGPPIPELSLIEPDDGTGGISERQRVWIVSLGETDAQVRKRESEGVLAIPKPKIHAYLLACHHTVIRASVSALYC